MRLRKFLPKVLIVAAIFSSSVLAVAAALHFWKGETLRVSQVEKRWGHQPLNEDKFREGDMPTRAHMAATLLQNQKKFIGKQVPEIRKLFGDPDGFYFSDMYPAYIIQEGQTREEETWQIVFLLDKRYLVSKIIVHKNCCER